jgi:hypothetical protein
MVKHNSGADNFFANALSRNPTGLSNEKQDILKGPKEFRVRVTLQLTVSQSVCLGVEPNLGLLTRDIKNKLQSCLIWGALSDERFGIKIGLIQGGC